MVDGSDVDGSGRVINIGSFFYEVSDEFSREKNREVERRNSS